ncbi:MAG: RbsD/FucU domain-containing protein [Planctomycetota bacterium]
MCRTIMKKMNLAGLAAMLVMTLLITGCVTSEDSSWKGKLAAELPLLGHRNWILIADSAYPAQSHPAIETVATGADHIRVVKSVLKAVDNAGHVQAVVYLDAEMEYVSEKDAPGIDAYRKELTALLGNRPVKSLPHEDLIAKLDQAAKMFRVLVLKTNLTLPYTSVFVELDCGYWNEEAERKLRQAIGQ